MRKLTLGLACSWACLAVFSEPALAQQKSWVGKTILTRRNDVKYGYTDDNGRQKIIGTLTFVDYRVLADRGGWLKVAHNGVEGWFDKSEAVVLDEAPAYFTARIRENPNDSNLYNRRAIAWELKGEFDIALKDYGEAIRLDPEDAALYDNRGDIFHKKRDYDRAIQDYSEALRLDPKYVGAYRKRAKAWVGKKDYAKAEQDFDQAIRLDPKHPYVYGDRGEMWFSRKEFDRAIQDLGEQLRLDPKSDWAYRYRGMSHSAKKDYARALADFNEALRLDPDDPAHYNSKAWLLATCPDAKFRDGKKAVELARKGSELAKDKDPNLFDRLAAAYAEAGQFDEAVRWQQRALDDPNFDRDELDRARRRLELYRGKKAFREE